VPRRPAPATRTATSVWTSVCRTMMPHEHICDYLFSASVKVCMPGCQGGFFDCAPDTCNSTTGRCEHNGPTGPGGACTADQNCARTVGVWVSTAQPDPNWPGGYCAPECSATGACSVGSACVRFTNINLCLDTCEALPTVVPAMAAGRGSSTGSESATRSARSRLPSRRGLLRRDRRCEAPADCQVNPCACNTRAPVTLRVPATPTAAPAIPVPAVRLVAPATPTVAPATPTPTVRPVVPVIRIAARSARATPAPAVRPVAPAIRTARPRPALATRTLPATRAAPATPIAPATATPPRLQ